MKIILKVDDEKLNDICIENAAKGEATYNVLLAANLSMMEAITKQFKEEVSKESPDADFTGMYDDMNALFDTFLRETFPEIKPLAFDLSDAALLYAQDKIIETAEKKGISYEEAMEKFERKAKEHLRQRREGYRS